ncbi:MAG: lipopolysaccharide transport periplasmic protein LptA [Sulfurimonas sp.]
MKYKLLSILLLVSTLSSDELKIEANAFNSDENTGISVFEGNVKIKKLNDELNASKVTVYTNEKKEPTKFVAVGDVSFSIETKEKTIYKGVAGKAIYIPGTKEYHFFKNVHLKQVNDKKEIIGDEVLLKTIEGKAYAKGIESEPVIMIFDIADDKNETKE